MLSELQALRSDIVAIDSFSSVLIRLQVLRSDIVAIDTFISLLSELQVLRPDIVAIDSFALCDSDCEFRTLTSSTSISNLI